MAFFRHFPRVDYGGHMATNLMARTKINKAALIDASGVIDYTIQDSDRPDIVAHLAYQDSEQDWAIYYANDVVDPYHDWYLNTNDFADYVAAKYGSIAQAVANTVEYKVASPDGEDRNIDHYGLAVNAETYAVDSIDPDMLQLYTYERVSAYDFEEDSNLSKLRIKLLNEAFIHEAEQQLIARLKE